MALSGTVSSAAEAKMEGVLVSAKREGSRITVTVVSDREGHFEFPASRMPAGHYGLRIRAVGYELGQSDSVEIVAGNHTEQNIALRPSSNRADQLTSAEWLMSVPGNDKQKDVLYRCVACHDLGPVMENRYDKTTWLPVLKRMENWVAPSVLSSPVKSPFLVKSKVGSRDVADYLASINLHAREKWDFPLLSFPRPSGDATRVIITEYDLPGDPSLPHDALVDRQGNVWYNDFQRPLVGRLDPRTGETKEWRLPVLREGFPKGLLEIKLDKDGNLWIPRFFQGCTLTKLDVKTGKFTSWKVDARYNDKNSRCSHVALGAPDGTVWFSDSGNRRMFKLDPKTGLITAYDSFPNYSIPKGAEPIEIAGRRSIGHRTYDIAVDSKGNGYFADIAGGTIGKIDAQTGKVTLYPTPTPESGPRRMYMDSSERLWFGENYASKLGMFDTVSKQFREWAPPVPWSGPYPAVADKNGDVWTVGMSTDFVYRLNPKTNKFTLYLLPQLGANLRKIDVDNSTTPVSIWVAEVLGGKIAKIEPLR